MRAGLARVRNHGSQAWNAGATVWEEHAAVKLMKAPPVPAGVPSKTKPKAATSASKGKPPSPTPPNGDWRADTLDIMRVLIQEADPDAIEEVKWRKPSNAMQGVAVWSHDGILCTGETYKDKVKLTFARGAFLEDPAGLFNADDRGGTRRAIDIREGETVDAAAFKALVKAAVAENATGRNR